MKEETLKLWGKLQRRAYQGKGKPTRQDLIDALRLAYEAMTDLNAKLTDLGRGRVEDYGSPFDVVWGLLSRCDGAEKGRAANDAH